MIRQRLTLVGGYPGGVWSCAACGSELSDGTISHRDACRWVAGIRDAERAKTREAIIVRLAAKYGPHKAYVSATRSYEPDGNDAEGSCMTTFTDGDGCTGLRSLSYGDIADALTDLLETK